MSAVQEPIPIRWQPAEPDAPLPPPRRRAWAWVLLIVCVVSGGSAAWMAATRKAGARQQAARPRATAVVRRGTLEVRLRVGGSTSARVFSNVVVPKLRMPEPDRPLTLMTLLPSGARVRKGDLIAAFDPQSVKDHLDDTRDTLHDRGNLLARRKALLDLEVEDLTQQLRKAKSKMDKALLDLGTIPVRSGIRAATLRLAAQEAEDEFHALEDQLPLRIQSQAASLRISELNEEMERLHVERHEQDLAHLSIHAPNDGTVVVQTTRRSMGDQITWSVGDRVTPGALLMRVVDTSRMQVEGTVNQTEYTRFRIGQEALVRVDAYPDALFRGRVHAIGALASAPGRHQYFLRTIPIRVEILDGDSRLLPDLSASAEVLVEREENVLLAPAQALREENGQTVVYVQTAEGVERRAVGKPRVHGTQAALLEGVEAGEIVVIDER